MNFKVLVFPCGSEIGLEIYHALKYSRHITLYGASSVSSNHGKYVYKNYIERLPYIDEPDFINIINTIIDKEKIDFLFPAHDSVLVKLTNCIEELHCDIIGSPKETCNICRSKKLTYETFKPILSVPANYSLYDNIEFPVFLKPDIGQGSKGTAIAYSRENIEFLLQENNSLLVLEYLPGKEYTVDCFTDRHGEIRFIGPRERTRIMNGISVDTHPVRDNEFKVIAEKINNTLNFRGPWFFQLKENKNGKLTLLEIAPRIAGTMALYRNLGINFSLLSIYDRANIDIEILCNNYNIQLDRALCNRYKIDIIYEHVYIDLDDCIILNNKINTIIISFLYECIGKNIKIHLLTRHKGDILTYLSHYRIAQLFDFIIQIDGEIFKSKYIKEKNSIFIDDSFSERLDVKKNLNIPVFGLDMMECLVNL